VRSAPGTWRLGARVSWLSLKTNVGGLLVVWPQNHWDGFSSVWASKPMATVCERFGLKTTRTVFTSLTSKPVVTVLDDLASKPVATVFAGLASKPVVTVFSSLASKLVATVSPSLASKPAVGFLVEPQKQGGGGFPGLSLKTGSFDLVLCASKSPRRFLGLGLKIKWASVCQLCHKWLRSSGRCSPLPSSCPPSRDWLPLWCSVSKKVHPCSFSALRACLGLGSVQQLISCWLPLSSRRTV
jgi:hypothetical protein